MWKLKDVLAAAGEPPMTTFSTNEDTDEYTLVKQVLPVAPCSVGVGQTLSIFASEPVFQHGFRSTNAAAYV